MSAESASSSAGDGSATIESTAYFDPCWSEVSETTEPPGPSLRTSPAPATASGWPHVGMLVPPSPATSNTWTNCSWPGPSGVAGGGWLSSALSGGENDPTGVDGPDVVVLQLLPLKSSRPTTISRVGVLLCTVNRSTDGSSTSSWATCTSVLTWMPCGRLPPGMPVVAVSPAAPPLPCQATSATLRAPGRFGPMTAAATAARTAIRNTTAPAL